MKRFLQLFLLFGVLAFSTAQPTQLQAQSCDFSTGLGCSNANSNNFGVKSIELDDPITIEYDNYVAVYHSTLVRTYTGKFAKVLKLINK